VLELAEEMVEVGVVASSRLFLSALICELVWLFWGCAWPVAVAAPSGPGELAADSF